MSKLEYAFANGVSSFITGAITYVTFSRLGIKGTWENLFGSSVAGGTAVMLGLPSIAEGDVVLTVNYHDPLAATLMNYSAIYRYGEIVNSSCHYSSPLPSTGP